MNWDLRMQKKKKKSNYPEFLFKDNRNPNYIQVLFSRMLPKMFELILDDCFLDVKNLNSQSTKFCEKNAAPKWGIEKWLEYLHKAWSWEERLYCGIAEFSIHEWENIWYMHLVIGFFSSRVSKLHLLLVTIPWHISCLPNHLMACCGCSLWTQFLRTSAAAEFWGVETRQSMGLIILHHQEIISSASSMGSPLAQVWGHLIFLSCLKEQRKRWTRSKETAM